MLLIAAAFVVCAISLYVLVFRPTVDDFASHEMQRGAERVAAHVEAFFSNVTTIAGREHALGALGVIDLDEPRRLSRLMLPLYNKTDHITSSAVAEDTGREILILPSSSGGWRNRLTDPDAWGQRARFITWDGRGTLVDSVWKRGDYDARQRPWFIGVMAQPRGASVYWTPPYRFVSTQELGISAVTRWRAPDGHRYAMTLDVRLMDLTRFTQQIRVAKSGLAAIVTANGRVLALPRDPRFSNLGAIKAALLQPVAAVGVAPLTTAFTAWRADGRPELRLLKYQVNGAPWLTMFYPVRLADDTFWVASLAPSGDFTTLPDNALFIGALIVLGTVVMASFGAVWLSGHFSTPIERLTAESTRLGRMELRHPISVHSRVHEIDVLARALDAMRRGLLAAQAEIEARTAQEIRAERAAQESRLQLLRAQKMEAVGQLTGGVAHDFNNLLAVIWGNLELIEEALGNQPQLHRLLHACVRAAERGTTLTRSLLAFSRQQPLEPRPVNVNGLVDELAELLHRTLPATIRLAVDAAATWVTEADPGQLQQAILNLATNAKDAMPDGGLLAIETRDIHADGAEARAEVAPGDYVMVAVRDTGHGMSPDILARAFDPVFTTKAPGKGSGLGLSMVYGFAKQSHGHLKIASEPGRGTTAFLYLPRSTTAPKPPLVQRPQSDIGGQGETILVVEDDLEMQTLVSTLVRSLGYEAVVASDGAAALDIVRTGLRPSVLLTDVVLPGGMNGPRLAGEARQLSPTLKVLYMSAYTDSDAIHDGRLPGAPHLLLKPFRKHDLATKLRAVLDEASP